MASPVHSLAQPLVCCVGTSVAGRPTQFLFERAASSLGMDWRAITVEVIPDRFQAACEALLAMRFRGLRLFGDLEARAATELAAEDSVARFIRFVTSGKNSEDRWVWWDNVGFAWIELLRQSPSGNFPIVGLLGDSRTTRSSFAALMSMAKSAPDWFWIEAPRFDQDTPWLPTLEQAIVEGRILQERPSPERLSSLKEWISESGRKAEKIPFAKRASSRA